MSLFFWFLHYNQHSDDIFWFWITSSNFFSEEGFLGPKLWTFDKTLNMMLNKLNCLPNLLGQLIALVSCPFPNLHGHTEEPTAPSQKEKALFYGIRSPFGGCPWENGN